MTMGRLGSSIALAVLLAGATGSAAAVESGRFDLKTTSDLLAVCTQDGNDPLYVESRYFCAGFFEGAGHYHDAVSGGDLKRLVCPPKGATLEQAVRLFIDWGEANAGDIRLMGEPPVIGVVRALEDVWPCS